MGEVRTYQGSCQCGAVRFEADSALEPLITCNCSRCRRTGIILTFVPQSAFRLLAGEDATTEYLFNKHAISHRFCSTCGIQAYATSETPQGPMAALNVRCLEGVDLDALEPRAVDGASF